MTDRWISPLQFIFGFFGYVKIPRAVVELSMWQEDNMADVVRRLRKGNADGHLNEAIIGWEKRLRVQQSLTQFLRSGRLL